MFIVCGFKTDASSCYLIAGTLGASGRSGGSSAGFLFVSSTISYPLITAQHISEPVTVAMAITEARGLPLALYPPG